MKNKNKVYDGICMGLVMKSIGMISHLNKVENTLWHWMRSLTTKALRPSVILIT